MGCCIFSVKIFYTLQKIGCCAVYFQNSQLLSSPLPHPMLTSLSSSPSYLIVYRQSVPFCCWVPASQPSWPSSLCHPATGPSLPTHVQTSECMFLLTLSLPVLEMTGSPPHTPLAHALWWRHFRPEFYFWKSFLLGPPVFLSPWALSHVVQIMSFHNQFNSFNSKEKEGSKN